MLETTNRDLLLAVNLTGRDNTRLVARSVLIPVVLVHEGHLPWQGPF